MVMKTNTFGNIQYFSGDPTQALQLLDVDRKKMSVVPEAVVWCFYLFLCYTWFICLIFSCGVKANNVTIIIGQAGHANLIADDAMLQKIDLKIRGNNTIIQACKATPASLAGAS